MTKISWILNTLPLPPKKIIGVHLLYIFFVHPPKIQLVYALYI